MTLCAFKFLSQTMNLLNVNAPMSIVHGLADDWLLKFEVVLNGIIIILQSFETVFSIQISSNAKQNQFCFQWRLLLKMWQNLPRRQQLECLMSIIMWTLPQDLLNLTIFVVGDCNCLSNEMTNCLHHCCNDWYLSLTLNCLD